MLIIKEDKLEIPKFIEQHYVSEEICDNIIDFFHSKSDWQQPGTTASGENQNKKKSTDFCMTVRAAFNVENTKEYMKHIAEYAGKYSAKYFLDYRYLKFIEPINIQHYKPGEGYFIFHNEREGFSQRASNRALVFMTYLNTIEDEGRGGTDFYFQEYTETAVKGKTLIWPADFSFRHKGNITHNFEKYIITGWISYEPKGEIVGEEK